MHQISCPYTPQQNELAERKHRHIIELSLAIMSHASIPSKFWDQIFQSVVFLINRLPPTTAPHSPPFTALFKKDPEYTFLRVLGCLCFPLLRPYNTHTLQYRSLPCIFLGYCQNHKGYKCLHIPTNKLYVSRNVRFDESIFPFSNSLSLAHIHSSLEKFNSSPVSVTIQPTSDPQQLSAFPLPLLQSRPYIIRPSSSSQQAASQPLPSTSTQQVAGFSSPSRPATGPGPIPPQQASTTHDFTPLPAPEQLPAEAPVSRHHMITRQQLRTSRPKLFPDHVTHLTTRHPLSIPGDDEPTSFTSEKKSPQWREAMANELNALAHNNMWVLVPSSPTTHVIGCK